jgi:pimeloyl-ACP methyl ester carboxylesterase
MTLNLLATDTTFEIPVVIIQGADDDIKPAEMARAYFDTITAPHKEFVAMQNAGHSVSVTRSDDFLKELVARVIPLTHSP